jgi:hypothetical protein
MLQWNVNMVTTVLSAVTILRTAATYLKYKHWSLVQSCQYDDFCNLTNLLGLLACGSQNFKMVWHTTEFASNFGNIRNEKTLSKCTYNRCNILGHKIAELLNKCQQRNHILVYNKTLLKKKLIEIFQQLVVFIIQPLP